MTPPEIHLRLPHDRRADLLAQSLKGRRRPAGGYILSRTRAAKMKLLHAAGYGCVHYRHWRKGWLYYGPGSDKLLPLHKVMRLLKPLDGRKAEVVGREP